MFEPINNHEFRENPDSPARAYLETIYHRIEWSKEAVEDFSEYQESIHKLREEKEEIFQKLLELYQSGDLEACYAIGCAYGSYDAGVKRNSELAHAFFLQAAEAGHPTAMRSYAFSCKRLNGHEDTTETIEWLKKAAKAGDILAMSFLGIRYREGDSLETNYDRAEFWFKSAYDAGDKASAYYLGKLYDFQLKDYGKAFQWYTIFADQNAKNFRDLARFLNREDTAYFDPAESLRLKIENLDDAYDHSRPIICGEIAEHYLNGRGVEASKEEALKWLRKKLGLLKPETKLYKETKLEIEQLEGSLI